MDEIINLLFNPNHEMPSGKVLIVLFLLCILVPYLMRYIQDKREQKHHSPPKKKKNK